VNVTRFVLLAVIAAAVSVLSVPHSAAVTHTADVAFPAVILLWCTVSAYRDQKRLAELEKKKLSRAVHGFSRAENGPHTVLSPRESRFLQRYPVGPGTPQEQLEGIARDYGLPAVTPLQKKELLPEIRLTAPGAAQSAHDFAESVKAFRAAVTGSVKPYIPEGQEDLSRDLLMHLNEEVNAAASRWNALEENIPAYEWHLSSEWLEEVCKLRDGNGRPLWLPRHRSGSGPGPYGLLAGYPVVTADRYGLPELTAR
jgi:hypothetical protein